MQGESIKIKSDVKKSFYGRKGCRSGNYYIEKVTIFLLFVLFVFNWCKKVSLIVFFQRENNNFIFSREKSNLVFFVPEACDLVKSFQEDEVSPFLGLSSILTILLAMALRY